MLSAPCPGAVRYGRVVDREAGGDRQAAEVDVASARVGGHDGGLDRQLQLLGEPLGEAGDRRPRGR